MLNGVFPLRQTGKHLQLTLFQLCHKADTAQIDPQYRNIVGVCILGRVQDGAITAKAEKEIRIFELLLHVPVILSSWEIHMAPLLQGKRETQRGLRPRGTQNIPGAQRRLQSPVPIGVGAEHHLHG